MLVPRLPLFLLAALCLTAVSAPASEESPDFWRTQQNILKLLQTRDIGTLASLPDPDSVRTSPEEAMQRFTILFLAGHDEAAAAFLPVLQLHEKALEVHNLSRMAEELIRRERWDLARRYMESLPRAEAGWTYVFLDHWNKEASPEEIDRWIDQRAISNPAFWSREHFRLAAVQKRQAALIENYHQRLQASPGDHNAAMELASGYEKNPETPDIDWLAKIYRPACPSDAYKVATALGRKNHPMSLIFLEKARDLPFGDADLTYMKERESQRQAFRGGEIDFKKDFRAMVRQEMMYLYQRTGQSAEAQKLLEQTAAEFPSGLPPSLMQAGQIQGASGAHVIENRILEAEKKPENQNTPEYWKGRGEYYSGRQEYDKAMEANQKVLAMCPVPTEEDAIGKNSDGVGQQRYWAINDLTASLQAQKRYQEAYDLMRKELSLWPPNFALSQHIASNLTMEFGRSNGDRPQADDEILWAWLSARVDWEYGGERLLRGMAENALPEEKNKFWNRAEKLTLKNPERSAILGWVMENQHEPARALVCLQRALDNLPEGEKRQQAACTLLGLYLSQKDWKNAAATLPSAALRLTFEEQSEKLGALAVIAAQRGQKKAAMELWTQAMNHERWSENALEDLVRAGMKAELIAFYENLVRKEPGCGVAVEKLKILQAKS